MPAPSRSVSMKASPRRAARRVARQARYVRRNGNTLTFAIGSVGAVAVLSLLGWWTFGGVSGDETPEFLTTEVSRGAYDFVVIEQGTVESATNTELRCQVRSRGGGGGGGDRGGGGGLGGSSTAIMDVVPEGTIVKEGDVVVELDSSSLMLAEKSKKILVSNREWLFAQAENGLNAAQIAKTEYHEGLYISQEKLVLTALFLTEQA